MRDKLETTINKLSKSCDYLDIRVEESSLIHITVIDGKLHGLHRETSLGGALRACHRGGWGFVSFNDLNKLEAFGELAVQQAKLCGHGKTRLAPVEPIVTDYATELIDSPHNHSLDEKIALLFHYDELMKSCPLIVNRTTKYGDKKMRKYFVSSEGSFITQELCDLYLGATPVAIHNGYAQKGKVERGSSNDFSVVTNLDEKIVAASQLAVEISKAAEVKNGVYPVIMDPLLASLFVHEAFGHHCEADNYAEQPQLAKIMTLGKEVASSCLTVYDSGLDLGTRGFVAYDDEGVKAQKTCLVQKGRLHSRLHSRETAALLDEKPTGNGRAVSYRFEPLCRMRNTYIENGETSFSEMVSSIDEGLYLLGCQGGFSDEDFSLNSLYGYVIHQGKLQEKVKGATLFGNLWQSLKNIKAVGDDKQVFDGPGGCGKKDHPHLAVSFGAPHILIEGLNVTSQ